MSESLLAQRAQDIEEYKDRLFAAESRLAEATGCLHQVWRERAALPSAVVEEVRACLLSATPAQAAIRAEDETHFACAVEVGASVATLNECKELLRGCWRGALTVDKARAIFQWFKAQGEDLNDAAQAAGLLKPVTAPLPPGCHCPPDKCHAPRVMGQQMPCRRAPAQAAEPERGAGSGLCGTCGSSLASLYQAAGREHPDTIALRERRAELDQAQQSLRIAHVHASELEKGLESARAERDTALARIARAVAELENERITSRESVRRALEALR